eukprot:TRINITY_DN6328_c0_g1_i1.p4 TRINITY_DN6328_c0_g1~~TRINITY_DN6328_c0_g1_i1.p4  ORF type:complete len:171 (-),score=38.00 TRINITY_DN6328_c0_g1_i1:330-806(-)
MSETPSKRKRPDADDRAARPTAASTSPITTVCVFCGSSPGGRPEYLAGAAALGAELAARGLDLVYGGGSNGLMGAVARAVHQGGRKVTGIIPRALAPFEVSSGPVADQIEVDTMHERKEMMANLSQATIALPGGLGCVCVWWCGVGVGQLSQKNTRHD